MIKSKYNCGQSLWFMRNNKPTNKFVYCIYEENNVIGYSFTSTAGYCEIPSYTILEVDVFLTKDDLIEALKTIEA